MMIVNDNYIVDFDSAFILSQRTGLRTSLGSNEVSLLRYMIQHTNQLLSRQTLMDEVWLNKGIVVEDSSLLHSISNCRKALEDKDTKIIQTQRGKGYLFLGVVKPYSSQPSEDDKQNPPDNIITGVTPICDATSKKVSLTLHPWWRYLAVYLIITASSFMLWRYASSPWTSADHYYIEQFTECVFTDPSTATETLFNDVTIYHANGLSLMIDVADTSISYQAEAEVDCE
ncbi:transcriptional regulator [Moritella dasanensis]|uniref:transcriptional regulator n=1 Tax=Moritella dasanensis TaxID=428031 RepID=UPI000474615A|nr:winged helix-turn-helix domain-containing protein [Moritella dasanensis]